MDKKYKFHPAGVPHCKIVDPENSEYNTGKDGLHAFRYPGQNAAFNLLSVLNKMDMLDSNEKIEAYFSSAESRTQLVELTGQLFEDYGDGGQWSALSEVLSLRDVTFINGLHSMLANYQSNCK